MSYSGGGLLFELCLDGDNHHTQQVMDDIL